MTARCTCPVSEMPKLIVLTGGPGGGKTTVLEVARRVLCDRVEVLPEAASILWQGGFPRRPSMAATRAAQRAIVQLQRELQRMATEEHLASVILCDRGTLDGLAYWPGEADEYFAETGLDRFEELRRYTAVIQLQPPTVAQGYQQSVHRPESAAEARAIDRRIAAAWSGHPRHVTLPATVDFLDKLSQTIAVLRGELAPSCMRSELLAHEMQSVPA